MTSKRESLTLYVDLSRIGRRDHGVNDTSDVKGHTRAAKEDGNENKMLLLKRVYDFPRIPSNFTTDKGLRLHLQTEKYHC